MANFLVDHALKHVWCSPEMDTPSIIRLARFSPRRGLKNVIDTGWEIIALPSTNEAYHGYFIGQIPKEFLGIEETIKETWVSLLELVNKEALWTNLYVDSGLEFPRGTAFIRETRGRGLIIAVKVQDHIADLSVESLYLRSYSNRYFDSVRRNDELPKMVSVGIEPVNGNDIVAINNARRYHNTLSDGHSLLFQGGYIIGQIRPALQFADGFIEHVYDSSIYRQSEFALDDLPTFTSELDAQQKYLVHPPKDDTDTIHYQDDIEFYLIAKEEDNPDIFKGVRLHQNLITHTRMLSHRDYALSVDHIVSVKNKLFAQIPNARLYLKLFVRRSGYRRELVFEKGRVHELYKLPDDLIKRAMLGLDSSVSVWTAEALEKSAYPEMMRSEGQSIEQAKVVNAYGYSAMCKIMADTPIAAEELAGNPHINVHYSHRFGATVCEYTRSGLIRGIFGHTQGERYYLQRTGVEFCEVLGGLPSER
ncbi:hypothetical protein, partial [Endozoicomonas sp. ONNA1]|uniref:DUF7193 family protein n=1 Tax=Endozoicomonas sp. ONNA1 TaxID=2828740 RepID=UPI002147B51F